MLRHRLTTVTLLMMMGGVSVIVSAQERPDPTLRIAAEHEAMVPLAYLDGVWRGPAWIMLPSGERRTFTQTERIGPFLDGSIKVIEGRGFGADGSIGFNAFGIISYNPDARAYSLHSHAQGIVGDFDLRLTSDGYVWEIHAGPATIRYTAVVRNGAWQEVGERIVPGQNPVRFLEMNLTRVGDTNWPAAGPVPPQ
jgi:hypothetical protein